MACVALDLYGCYEEVSFYETRYYYAAYYILESALAQGEKH